MLQAMRWLLGAFLSLVSVVTGAAVYKWVGPDGEVTYSDRPQPGAEQVQVAPVQTYEAPELPENEVPQGEGDGFSGYESFAIVVPNNDETFRDNGGLVEVKLQLTPGLQRGHRISVYMDGQSLGGEGRSTSLVLRNVDRGSHRLHAAVVDEEGDEVARTEPVVFHMHRTSRLINP